MLKKPFFISIMMLLSIIHVAVAQSRPTDFSLANLTPSTGVLFYGVNSGSEIGGLVSDIGDINGDGFDDIILGAEHVSSDRGAYAVILGQASGFHTADGVNVQTNLPLSTGFMIIGAYPDDLWGRVASGLGDFNGDHLGDFIICSDIAKLDASSPVYGACYVFLGQSAVQRGPTIDLSTFEVGTNADPTVFKIIGPGVGEMAGCGASKAGDVNDDGFGDIIIGVKGRGLTGAAVVIFGHHYSQPFPDIDLSSFVSGSDGFWVLGEISGGQMGNMVSSAGDFNGDGYSDVIIGAPKLNTFGGAGVAYVLFGTGVYTMDVDIFSVDEILSSGSRAGFRVVGGAAGEETGHALAGGGDINDDGISDILIGSLNTSSYNRTHNGAVFVLFGHTSTTAFLDIALLHFISDPSVGVKVHGATSGDMFGYSVSLGDVNGDSIGDIIVGAPAGDQIGVFEDVGMVYVIYGRRASYPFTADIDMFSFTTGPGRGIVIAGQAGGDYCGAKVSRAGDFNNDGAVDVLIGATGVSNHIGEAYLLYGTPPKVPIFRTAPVYQNFDVSTFLPSMAGFRIIGEFIGDRSGSAVSQVGDFNGDGIDDYMVGADSANRGAIAVGIAYVVFGTDSTHPVEELDLQTVTNGVKGFRIIGDLAEDRLGIAVSSAGDFNGDGYADVLVGAYHADSASHVDAGVVFVIFGHSDASPYEDVDTSEALLPTLGLKIYGESAGDGAGFSVACAGDVNGDGIDDIVIGAHEADKAPTTTDSGKAYVIFGQGSWGVTPALNLSDSLTGIGFRIIGAAQGDQCGHSVSSAGDFNGDGYADIIVGCSHASPGGVQSAGLAYLLFADRGLGYPDIMLDSFASSSTTGLKIIGAAASHFTGYSVSSAGDVNGDGLADVLVCAPNADPFSREDAGIVYVIFGHKSSSYMDVELSANSFVDVLGFRIFGAYAGDSLFAVSGAGDVNGDGINDILVGAEYARDYGGTAYVLFGRTGNNTDVDLLYFEPSTTTGVQIFGVEGTGYGLGISVSAAGDVNHDGVGDIIIGSGYESTLGRSEAGVSYVLFGMNSEVAFNDLDLSQFYTSSSTGLIIQGVTGNKMWKNSVKNVGDVNGDGIDDIIMATSEASYLARTSCGIAYVIFGDATDLTPYDLDLLDFNSGPSTGFRIIGAASLDVTGAAVSGAGDINHDGFSDVMVSSMGTGVTYVLFGHSSNGPVTDIDLAFFVTGPTRGFRIIGRAEDYSGLSLANLGDVNGDSVDDIIVGAYGADYEGLSIAGVAYVIYGVHATDQQTMSDVNLTTISQNMSLGFSIVGASAQAGCGFSVGGAGDFNNDGLMDIVVGSPLLPSSTGLAHVVFGNTTRAGVVDVSTLASNPQLGFCVVGPSAGAYLGWSVSGAGDVNGDGFDDMIIGAKGATVPPGRTNAGITYLIFGRATSAVVDIDCSTFETSLWNGYKILGAVSNEVVGYSVSDAGDLNGDGYADIVVGAAQGSMLGRNNAGKVYVLFGKDRRYPVSDIDMLTFQSGARTGFIVKGATASDITGISVSAAGDVNADGVSDLLVAAHNALLPGGARGGLVYVIFGDIPAPTSQPSSQPSMQPSLQPSGQPSHQPSSQPTALPTSEVFDVDLRYPLRPHIGLSILGAGTNYSTGASVSSAGDFNGDGYEDIIIGIPNAEFNSASPGAMVVLYGNASHSGLSNIDLTEPLGSRGVRIYGVGDNDLFGGSVSSAGDFNKDGYDDILVGAVGGTANGRPGCGFVYLILGNSAFPHQTDLSSVDLAQNNLGFRIFGAGAGDALGTSVSSAGDINGDGFGDIILGAKYADPTVIRADAGIVYVLFGEETPQFISDFSLIGFTANAYGFRILGHSMNDHLGTSVSGAGDMNGDGYDDMIAGAPNAESGVGAAYVLFGHASNVVFPDISIGTDPYAFYVSGGSPGSLTGNSVSHAGDFNGDGFSDVMVSAHNFDSLGRISSGLIIVLFGHDSATSFPDASLTSTPSDGEGFLIGGAVASGKLGYAMSGGRDINGDGISDIVVSAPYTNTLTASHTGTLYVLYGHDTSTPFVTIDLANFVAGPTTGYTIVGAQNLATVGYAVSLADFNGDGTADVLIGAPNARLLDGTTSGGAYVLYGEPPLPPRLPNIDLKDSLSDSVGFSIIGRSNNDSSGYVVSNAGDVNGDGVDDIIIGAPYESTGNISNAGAAYVLFGNTSNTPRASFDLSSFKSGQEGFKLLGVQEGAQCGISVSGAGDFNDDGIDDVIVGCHLYQVGIKLEAGAAFVVFGSASPSDHVDINLDETLSGVRGFRVLGADPGDHLGFSVSCAGDIDNGGVNDIVIGAPNAYVGGVMGGAAYVLFGRSYSLVDVDISQGFEGFSIFGASATDKIGYSVAAAGDFNNDGFADVVVAGPQAWNTGRGKSGTAHVVLGRSYFGVFNDIDLAFRDGAEFAIVGAKLNDNTGHAVNSAGDLNEDGFSDILVSSLGADPKGRTDAGTVHVLFGHGEPYPDIDLLNFVTGPTTGFVIVGAVSYDRIGSSVSSAGDVNYDGRADIAIGSSEVDAFEREDAGTVYVIFGRPVGSLVTDIDLRSYPFGESTGFVVYGGEAGENCGSAVSFADVNGDGGPDILIGSPYSAPHGRANAGSTHVLYGIAPPPPPSAAPTIQPSLAPSGTPSFAPTQTILPGYTIIGEMSGDYSGSAVSGAGDVNGDGLSDIIIGAYETEYNGTSDCGTAYVVFGLTDLRLSSIDLASFVSGNSSGFKIIGTSAFLKVGKSVGGAGDINDDGFDDLIVGSEADFRVDSISAGFAFVVFGHSPSLPFADIFVSSEMAPSQFAFSMKGAVASDTFGYSVSGAGDFNGDGYDDIVVGAVRAGVPERSFGGKVFVILGHSNDTAFPNLLMADFFTSNNTGFVVSGASTSDQLGFSVSGAGDVNGDGLDDIILGAPYHDKSVSITNSGAAYVIFGRKAIVDIDLLQNATSGSYSGFRVTGSHINSFLGYSVSAAGDINNDGYPDIIVGAVWYNYLDRIRAGATYVIFGQDATLPYPDIDYATYNSSGLLMVGSHTTARSGWSVSGAGDLNGDGVDDIIIGTPYRTIGTAGNVGSAYVIYGNSSFGEPLSIIDLLTFQPGPNSGVIIAGAAANDQNGISVSAAGDVNGDGGADIVVGAGFADPFGRMQAGSTSVYYGTPPLTPMPTVPPSMQPTQSSLSGYKAHGGVAGDVAGKCVSDAGDVNGDGLGDVVIGVSFFDVTGPIANNGAAFVLFGHTMASYLDVDLLTFQSSNAAGFRILGSTSSLKLGHRVSGAGDVNGDGYDDVIVGTAPIVGNPVLVALIVFGHSPVFAPFVDIESSSITFLGYAITGPINGGNLGWTIGGIGDFNGDGYDDIAVSAFRRDVSSGKSYVILGHSNSTAFDTLQMTVFAPSNTTGFVIQGAASNDQSGSAIDRAGDVNGDGLDDLLIGAPFHDSNNVSDSGIVYLIFGKRNVSNIDLLSFTSGPQSGLRILGATAGDLLGSALSTGGDMNKDGYDDIVLAAPMASVAGRINAGAVYVLFGSNFSVPFGDFNLSANSSDAAVGFAIYGATEGERCGFSVSNAGDVNGDRFDDIVVGSPLRTIDGNPDVGMSYVIFGHIDMATYMHIDLLSFESGSSAGFLIAGAAADDQSGFSVSNAGDVDGDGAADLIIGAPGVDLLGALNVGAAYVYYGTRPPPTLIPTSLPTYTTTSAPSMPPLIGYHLLGAAPFDQNGYSVSSAGDVNGDGFGDIIIGSPNAAYGSATHCGISYVIFGNRTIVVEDIDLRNFTSGSSTGFKIVGRVAEESVGYSVSSAGDMNGDGYDDVIVGTYAWAGAINGSAYVVFGHGPSRPYEDVFLSSVYYGFRIIGTDPRDRFGSSVSDAGDFNGDGYADIIVSAPWSSVGQFSFVGTVFVLFGHSNATAFPDLDMSTFKSNNLTGFMIVGEYGNGQFGKAVSCAGDVNNDGFDDVIIGAPGANSTGVVYVIFGRDNITAIFLQDHFVSSTVFGLRIYGASTDDLTGTSVSGAGDVNHDGIADFIIGAHQADPFARNNVGAAYVFFGHDSNLSFEDIFLANFVEGTSLGFALLGSEDKVWFGFSVSGAGDVNGDGIDDIIIGASRAAANGVANVGRAFVIFGHTTASPFLNIDMQTFELNVQSGFFISGATPVDQFGFSVSAAGDVNGDGSGDLIVGSRLTDPFGRTNAGSSFVVYGTPPPPPPPTVVPSTHPTMEPTMQPTRTSISSSHIFGAADGDNLGRALSGAGDVNGDGIEDFIIGANLVDFNGTESVGAAYVLFGQTACSITDIDLIDFQSGNSVGFKVIGDVAYRRLGWAVSGAGDINGDGYDDVIVGSLRTPGSNSIGTAYVFFGHGSEIPFADIYISNFSRVLGFELLGTSSRDTFGSAVGSAGDFNGDGYDDIIIGASQADPMARYNAGAAYVIFGHDTATAFPDIDMNSISANTTIGFTIVGAADNDQCGSSVSFAGDVNEDGFSDILVGAPFQDHEAYGADVGVVYLIFGRTNATDIDLLQFISSQTHGLRIVGSEGDAFFGLSVSAAGDVNHDSYADILIGAYQLDYDGRTNCGAAVVLFGSGSSGFYQDVELANFTAGPTSGFRIYGANQADSLGRSLSGGFDVNGDGISDIIVGAHLHRTNDVFQMGISYVIYGHSTETPFEDLDMLDFAPSENSGFVVAGENSGDFCGFSVSSVGDVNGDGGADVIIGSVQAGYQDRIKAGNALLVYGIPPAVPQGFHIFGANIADRSGISVSDVGDFNGDGLGDIIIGASLADFDGIPLTGVVFVVFGRSVNTFADVDLLRFVSGPDTGLRIFSNTSDLRLGRSVSGAGDVNGDGYDDVIMGIGTSLSSIMPGQVYIVFGHGPSIPYADISVNSPFFGFTVSGAHIGDHFGFPVSNAGDFNGDGFDDVIVGSPAATSVNDVNTGKAYVIFGHSNSTSFPDLSFASLPQASAVGFAISGASMGDQCGASVSAAGDVNGDGLDDIIVSALRQGWNFLTHAGVVYVIFGRLTAEAINLADFVPGTLSGMVIIGGASYDLLGASVGAAGDVNADGFDDVIVGASGASPLGRNGAGLACVIFGHTALLPFTYIDLAVFTPSSATGFCMYGATNSGSFGTSVSGAGDVNGDGVDDVIIGAPSYTASASYIIYGVSLGNQVNNIDMLSLTAEEGLVLVGRASDDFSGYSVSAAGDVNGDGGADVIIGAYLAAPYGRSTAGSTYVHYGTPPPARSTTGFHILGADAGNSQGYAVSDAGDVNGDGFGDVVVGSHNQAYNGVSECGIAYVLFGRAAKSFADVDLQKFSSGKKSGFRVIGTDFGLKIGRDVSGAGDVNGDGYADVVIGSFFAVYIIFGHNSATSFADVFVSKVQTQATTFFGFQVNGVTDNDYFGTQVSNAGDFNGDGYDDIIIGAPRADPLYKSNAGSAYVIFGHSNATSFPNIQMSTFVTGNVTGFAILGAVASDQLGYSVGGGGDINGDGLDDVIVGAPYFDRKSPTRSNAGAVYVIFGRTNVTNINLLTFASSSADGYRVLGSTGSNNLGWAVSIAGDVNHDGFDDAIISPFCIYYADMGMLIAQVIFGHNSSLPFTDIDPATFIAGPTSGFPIYGSPYVEHCGSAVSGAGDVNGDGIDDIIVGSPNHIADTVDAGTTYVIFGQLETAYRPRVDLVGFVVSDQTGFTISGTASQDLSGWSVSRAGDFNGDGLGDLVIGTFHADPLGRENAGSSYVKFGSLPSKPGYGIVGAQESDYTAQSVSGAGDVNGDGIDDLIVGVPFAHYNDIADCGLAYIVFGKTGRRVSDMDLLDFASGNDAGFRVLGTETNLRVGRAVSGAGDINGDGYDDVLIGSYPPTGTYSGTVWLVFGHHPSLPFVDLLLSLISSLSSRGFRLMGASIGDNFGLTLGEAGDFNGDGYADVVVGAIFADPSSRTNAGCAYVIFGHRKEEAFADTEMEHFVTSNTTGFHVYGAKNFNNLGRSVSGAGDVNGDGLDDLIIGAPAENNAIDSKRGGVTYVVFGSMLASDIDAQNFTSGVHTGIRLYGSQVGDLAGWSANAAGDINNDGFADIIIGGYQVDPFDRANAGAVYVIFGREFSLPFTDTVLSTFVTGPTVGFRILGAYTDHQIAYSVSYAGDVNGDGVGDIVIGARLHIPVGGSMVGAAYVIFGHNFDYNVTDIDLLSFVPGNASGFIIEGVDFGDQMGFSVSRAGDINADGGADLIVGAPFSNPLYRADAGSAFVFYGTPPPFRSDHPTSQPSGQPSGQPSTQPSNQPFSEPTSQPTVQPSEQPSGQPSAQPSAQPTTQPSEQPSTLPSAQPSDQPSTQPSVQPSRQPTHQPTSQPSEQPSGAPSSQPTNQPSEQPSGAPSSQPTSQPSEQPSGAPSSQPTNQPSEQPSGAPNSQPTGQPSMQPLNQPSAQPSERPSAQPTALPSQQPLGTPTTQPSSLPSTVPSSSPSATPSAQPVGNPSGQPTSQPSSQPTAQPIALPSSAPSAQPFSHPSSQPSDQPSGSPSSQPTSQPSRKPTSQPSVRPSGVPTAQPTAGPSGFPTGEWATLLDKQGALEGLSVVQDNVWACGGAQGVSAASCVLVSSATGTVITQYGFTGDTVGSVIMGDDVSRVIVNGQSKDNSTVSSAVANCRIEQSQLTCSVKSFINAQFASSVYIPFTNQVVYVGLFNNKAALSITNNDVSTVRSFTYSTSYMKSIQFRKVASLTNFIGAFVVGTSVTNNVALSNSIVLGWIRVDTGTMVATYFAPAIGNIVGTSQLVNALAVEPSGPDTFIGGGLELSSGTAGMQAYLLRANALYRSISYAVRFVNQAASGRRRVLTTASSAHSAVKGMVFVDSLLFAILDDVRVTSTSNTTSLSIIKANPSSGAVLAQVSVSAPNADIQCTDITSSGLMLIITCGVKHDAGTRTLLLSVDRDLSCKELPRGFARSREEIFRTENVGLVPTSYPTTATSTWISTKVEAPFNSTEVVPSAQPTRVPTAGPSTRKPTAIPSVQPSDVPSSRPSSVPSALPSGHPSSSPTAAPSVSPQPTSQPSTSGPTNTRKPTVISTIQPTRRPSTEPTVRPTVRPSTAPTRKPSKEPTVQPSVEPTAIPSAAPTTRPSQLPTVVATVKPTSKPTRGPSSRPTTTPTKAPTMQPTVQRSASPTFETGNKIVKTPTMVIALSVAAGVVCLFLCALLYYTVYSKAALKKRKVRAVAPSPLNNLHPV